MNLTNHIKSASPGNEQAKIKHDVLSQIDFDTEKVSARALFNEFNKKQKISVPILFFVLTVSLYCIAKLGSLLFNIDIYLAAVAIFASALCLKLITGAPIFALVTQVLKRMTPLGLFHKKNEVNIKVLRTKLAAAMKLIRLSDYAELAAGEPDTQEVFELVMDAKDDEYGYRAFIESPTLMFILLGLLIQLQDLSNSTRKI